MYFQSAMLAQQEQTTLIAFDLNQAIKPTPHTCCVMWMFKDMLRVELKLILKY